MLQHRKESAKKIGDFRFLEFLSKIFSKPLQRMHKCVQLKSLKQINVTSFLVN